jgi:hypothetical protein
VENPPVMGYVRLNMLAARSGADEILSVLGNERAGKGELLQDNMEERA